MNLVFLWMVACSPPIEGPVPVVPGSGRSGVVVNSSLKRSEPLAGEVCGLVDVFCWPSDGSRGFITPGCRAGPDFRGPGRVPSSVATPEYPTSGGYSGLPGFAGVPGNFGVTEGRMPISGLSEDIE